LHTRFQAEADRFAEDLTGAAGWVITNTAEWTSEIAVE
jgi:hypothetical protein